eukprot:50461-Rhodomonas_salina.2
MLLHSPQLLLKIVCVPDRETERQRDRETERQTKQKDRQRHRTHHRQPRGRSSYLPDHSLLSNTVARQNAREREGACENEQGKRERDRDGEIEGASTGSVR